MRSALLALLLGLSPLLTACSSVTSRPLEPATGPEPAFGQQAVKVALQYQGAPYRWGGAAPSGFDCSGFVQYVFAQLGVALPHNAARQYALGTPVSRDRLQPGDLVFFDGLRHNGIYIGQGRFIHARQTGRRVGVARLDDHWYHSHYSGARRLQLGECPDRPGMESASSPGQRHGGCGRHHGR
jgi:cell wall-associated NlpC family hydrolase